MLNKSNEESLIFQRGYKAELKKNIGKITKFITVAKFSNCLITEEINSAKAFNMIEEIIITGIVENIAKSEISTP